MSNEFDPDCPYGHTYAGRPARIICTNAEGPHPIVALIKGLEGGGECARFFSFSGEATPAFLERLVNAAAPKRKFVKWMNVYRTGDVAAHDTEESANRRWQGRIACIRVEFEEGDGL